MRRSGDKIETSNPALIGITSEMQEHLGNARQLC